VDTEGASRVVSNLINAGTLPVFVPLAVLAVVLSGPLARRLRTSRALAALSLLSIAGIVAATFREQDLRLWLSDLGAVITCSECTHLGWLTDAGLWSRASQVDAAWSLNLALFVPAGLFTTLATHRPWRVLVALAGLSLLIEVVQDLTYLGAPDPADLLANVLGAALGVILAAGYLSLVARLRPSDATTPPSRRAMLPGVAAIALLVGLGWLGVQVGADMRQAALRTELGTAFAGTTATAMALRMASDEGFSGILAAVTTRPGYLDRVGETDEFEGRYTTQFFGAYRCVYIRWTTDGFTLRDASGDECAEFRERPPSD
jgi:VanZ like family